MKVLLGFVVRADNGTSRRIRRRLFRTLQHAATELVRYGFPAYPETIATTSWADLQSGTALFHWTNEGLEGDDFSDGGAIAHTGYVGSSFDSRDGIAAPSLLDYVTDMAGCFALMRAQRGMIEGVTDFARSNSLFYAESPGARFLGSRALLVHLLAGTHSSDRPEVRIDLDSISDMVAAGYFFGDHTPYAGVTALEGNQLIRLTPWRTELRVPKNLEPVIDASSWSILIDNVAEALVGAFDPIPGPSMRIALTGGRDSRLLVAAAVNREDLALTTSTAGMPDDPDVVIASQIADLIGVEHVVQAPSGVRSSGEIMAEEAVDRITRVLDVLDGMTSAWDDIEDYGPFVPTPILSGVGGEVVRGGLALHGVPTLDSVTATNALMTVVQGTRFLTDAVIEERAEMFSTLLDLARHDPYQAVDDLYFIHRNGRWIASRRNGARFRRRMYDPMLDNRFMRMVRQIPARQRWEERLTYELISVLAPQLADLPIEGAPWRFDLANSQSEDTTFARRVLTRSPSTMAFSWKTLKAPEARRMLTDLVMEGVEGSLAPIVDETRTRAYLEASALPSPAHIWHLATATILMRGQWFRTSRPARQETVRLTSAAHDAHPGDS